MKAAIFSEDERILLGRDERFLARLIQLLNVPDGPVIRFSARDEFEILRNNFQEEH